MRSAVQAFLYRQSPVADHNVTSRSDTSRLRRTRVTGASRPRHGFTLIELIITVAIVAILASAVLPLSQIAAQRAKEQELRSALRQIRESIDKYKETTDEGRVMKKADASPACTGHGAVRRYAAETQSAALTMLFTCSS